MLISFPCRAGNVSIVLDHNWCGFGSLRVGSLPPFDSRAVGHSLLNPPRNAAVLSKSRLSYCSSPRTATVIIPDSVPTSSNLLPYPSLLRNPTSSRNARCSCRGPCADHPRTRQYVEFQQGKFEQSPFFQLSLSQIVVVGEEGQSSPGQVQAKGVRLERSLGWGRRRRSPTLPLINAHIHTATPEARGAIGLHDAVWRLPFCRSRRDRHDG